MYLPIVESWRAHCWSLGTLLMLNNRTAPVSKKRSKIKMTPVIIWNWRYVTRLWVSFCVSCPNRCFVSWPSASYIEVESPALQIGRYCRLFEVLSSAILLSRWINVQNLRKKLGNLVNFSDRIVWQSWMGICEVDHEGPRKIRETIVQLHFSTMHLHFAELVLN